MPAFDHIDSIAARYRAGETLEQIGQSFGITRERIRQLLRMVSVSSCEGGARVRKEKKVAARLARMDRASFAKNGMSREDYLRINGPENRIRGMRPSRYFQQQMNNARIRGIPFELTFADWWKLWVDSGKWNVRGRGHGAYVMSRHGDVGPYALGNVSIKLADENNSEFIRRAWATGKMGKASGANKAQSPEVIELLALGRRPGVAPSRACANLGLSGAVWGNLRRGTCKTIPPERAAALRAEFDRMAKA